MPRLAAARAKGKGQRGRPQTRPGKTARSRRAIWRASAGSRSAIRPNRGRASSAAPIASEPKPTRRLVVIALS